MDEALQTTCTQLYNVARVLARRCDMAQQEDGIGFNKVDAPFGHRIADLSPKVWTYQTALIAYKRLYKYRKQLAQFGIDFSSIKNPEEIVSGGQFALVSDTPKRRGTMKKEVVLDGQSFVIRFPYDKHLVAEVRGIPARRWDPTLKAWRVEFVKRAVPYLRDFIRRYDFEVSPQVTEALDALYNNREVRIETVA